MSQTETGRGLVRWGLIGAGLLVGVAAAWTITRDRAADPPQPSSVADADRAADVTLTATIYRPDASLASLTPTPTTVETVADLSGQVAAVAAVALGDPFIPTDVFVYGSTAVIGYSSSLRSRFDGGAADELLAVAGLVNSVVATFDAIDAVTIVIDGRPAELFARHVDISRPFGFDDSMTALP